MIHPLGATHGCWVGGELGIVGIMARVLQLRGAEWVEEGRSVCAFIHSLTHEYIHPSFLFVQQMFLKCPVCATLRGVSGERDPADVLRREGWGNQRGLLGQIGIALL